MAIKRYVATKDNTITNAFKANLSTRGTGSNMGASDISEVFSIYGQQTTSSAELSRVLVKFPTDTISAHRTNDEIPVSGSVKFYLRMFNARHSEQLPEDFSVNVYAVSQSWEEGSGLDMETYKDKTKDATKGSNWINRLTSTTWKQIGGVYHSSSYVAGTTMPNYTFHFSKGYEDVELDITSMVEEWIAGTQENYGIGVFLTSSYEAYTTASDSVTPKNTDGVTKSYYTKRFFSRSSEFFFKRPSIEARWDSRTEDDRGNFYFSSSLAPAKDNLNTIYLYNYVRGQLKNIPDVGTGKVLVSLYSGSNDDSKPSDEKLALSQCTASVVSDGDFNVTGAYVSTGIYSASFALTGSSELKTIYDVWYSSSVNSAPFNGVKQYSTGTIKPQTLTSPGWNQYTQYVSKITNLKSSYSKGEKARFRVFVRSRDFSPTIYTVAKTDIEKTIIPSASYEIIRMVDEGTVVDNSTGSTTYHTYLSYDKEGNYFDLDMSLLEPGYMYGVKFAYHTSGDWREQEEVFKFRVEDN